jgi:hypothetical protein
MISSLVVAVDASLYAAPAAAPDVALAVALAISGRSNAAGSGLIRSSESNKASKRLSPGMMMVVVMIDWGLMLSGSRIEEREECGNKKRKKKKQAKEKRDGIFIVFDLKSNHQVRRACCTHELSTNHIDTLEF